MLKYNIQIMNYTLLYTKEDVWYSVSVLELPWCISEWDTKTEAKINIIEAIKLYLESMTDIAKDKAKNNKNFVIDSLKIDYETV